MTPHNPKQKYLIAPEAVFGLQPLRKYELLFETLDPCLAGCFPSKTRGRRPLSREALLNALIYKNLKQLPTLFDLASTLIDHPRLAAICGLPPNRSLWSLEERLFSFLEDIPNRALQTIRVNLVKHLIERKEISGSFLSIDSAAVPMMVKENNLKTAMNNRFDKGKPPKRDPEARLGVMIYFANPFQKEPRYFWGYRNHSITDCDAELPVWEMTKPANVQDTSLFIPLFKKLLEHCTFEIQAVMGDAAYDSEDNLKFVIDELHALPRVARNPQWEKTGSLQSPLQDVESVSPVLRCSTGAGSKIEERSVKNSSVPSPILRNSSSTFPPALGTIPPSEEAKAVPPISEEIRRSEKRSIMGHRFSKNITIKGPVQSEFSRDSSPCVCKDHPSMASML